MQVSARHPHIPNRVLELKFCWELPPQTPDPNINSLASLLDEVDFDSGELKNLLLAYATIKKKDAEKSIKAEEKERNEEKTTFYIDKEYIYPDRVFSFLAVCPF